MTTITEVSEIVQELLTKQANKIGRESGFIQRERQLTGAGFAQALVLGELAQPYATRKQLHHQVIQAGVQISVQGLDQRFDASAARFLRVLLSAGMSQLVNQEAETRILPQFQGVYVTDCTRLVWGAVGVKMVVRWELQGGRLQACLTDLHQHDSKTAVVEQALPPGALHLGDLGFFKLERFRQWSAAGVYWLTRYKVGTQLYTLSGEKLDLQSLLQGKGAVNQVVQVGQGHRAVTASLIAAPIPPEGLAKRLTHLHETARLKQRPLSSRQRELAAWTIYLTNVPDLSFAQAHSLARTRWQIELLFKLWKSHAAVLHSRSANPFRQQCEGYAKLLGILIAHWSLLVAGWQLDRLSSLDALRIVRTYLPLLQHAFLDPPLSTLFFHWLHHDLCHAPPLPKPLKSPRAFQLWASFDALSP